MSVSAPTATTRGGVRAVVGELAFPGLLLLVGLFLGFYPTFLSGFDQVQSNLGDSRATNYILEHSFRWLGGWPTHASYWDAPIYYPASNVSALHDTMLTMGPLYWLWRWLGAAPESAFQAFLIAVAVVNYLTACLLLRSGLKLSTTAATGGAFLFAFANGRFARLHHPQLFAQFFVVLLVLALVLALRAPDRTRRRLWIGAFFAFLVAQLWCGWYWGWFTVLSLGIVGIWVVANRQARQTAGALVREEWPTVVGCGLVAVAAAAPMVVHHMAAATAVGFHDYGAQVAPKVPRLASWFYVGPPNLAYGLLQETLPFRGIPFPVEHQVGVGFVTTFVALWGLYGARARPLIRALIVVGIALVVLSTTLPGGFTLWRLVYELVPGAGAIRAVIRVGVFLLLPLAAGLGLALSRLESRGRHLVAALLLAVCVIEQVRVQPSYDKQMARERVGLITDQVSPTCPSFYVSVDAGDAELPYLPWKYHLEAVWAQLELGIPSVNGHMAVRPAGWSALYDNVVRRPADEARIGRALEAWMPPGAAEEVCRASIPGV